MYLCVLYYSCILKFGPGVRKSETQRMKIVARTHIQARDDASPAISALCKLGPRVEKRGDL